ncbi:MAG: putative multidrug resistance protein EmrK [Gemmatimonadaceae bacterium]|nr:putative multidrug resistance protein EmrK [Gemmatimonadaceae bacterium]
MASSAPSTPLPSSTPAAAPTDRRSRRPILLAVVAVAVVVASAYAYRTWSYGQRHASTDNAQIDGHIMPILSRVGGYVKLAGPDDNARVRAGDTLVVIEDSEYRARLASAEADFEAARVVAGGRGLAGQSQAQIESATSQRAVLESQIAAARATYEKAKADLARLAELADKHVVSRQQLDAAQWAVTNSAAVLEGAERQTAGATAGIAGAQAGERLAQARLRAAGAALDNARLQLSYTTIVAPRAGIVARRQIEPGQLVQPGQPLLTIVDDRDIWVTANFKETQLSRIRVGQSVDLDIDAYEGCVARGTVESLSAATGARFALLPPDNATGNFTKVVQRVPVRIRITEACGVERPLRPGMSLVAHVVTS